MPALNDYFESFVSVESAGLDHGPGPQLLHESGRQPPDMQVLMPNHGRIHAFRAIQPAKMPPSIKNSFMPLFLFWGFSSMVLNAVQEAGCSWAHRARITASNFSCKPAGNGEDRPRRKSSMV